MEDCGRLILLLMANEQLWTEGKTLPSAMVEVVW